jgi:hypothetical protein
MEVEQGASNAEEIVDEGGGGLGSFDEETHHITWECKLGLHMMVPVDRLFAALHHQGGR